MKKTQKLTYTLILALVLTAFSCNNDDEATVTEPTPVVTEITICSNDTYTWAVNSITYEGSAGTQSVFIAGTNGVADQTLNLTVSSQPTEVVTDVTICSDDTYTWAVNATSYDGSAGTQSIIVEGENCAADQILNLTVTTKPTAIVTDVTICSDETYTWAVNGTDYDGSAGTQSVTIEGENCEADQTLNITVTPKPTEVVTDVTISANDTYTWPVNSITYNGSTGTQTVLVEGENCTADQILNITVTIAIGDFIQGGVVFWLDPANNNSGLVCAVSDQSTNTVWGCYGSNLPGTIDTAIGTGAANTAAIEAGCTTTGTAADIVSNLTLNGYSDWFLPSLDELNEMYLNKTIINSTATANSGTDIIMTWYWTSTQQNGNANNAYIQFFANGSQALNAKANLARVRAVRAFTDF